LIWINLFGVQEGARLYAVHACGEANESHDQNDRKVLDQTEIHGVEEHR